MSIAVGIDIGNDNCVVAVVNEKGVVDVLHNEASKRETPMVVYFAEKQRLFGSTGAASASRNPKSTISQLKRIIGRRFDEPSFQKERDLLPYETSAGPNGEILVNVRYLNEDRTFTAVQLLGMFLSHLKSMAEKTTGSTISDCVIGVPAYFTDQQRRAYLLSAEIAGLKPLRLFHDGAATALDYGMFRNLPYGEATHVVFVDIGHCDTQVTVVKFSSGTLTVRAHSFDRDLGGRDFDHVIFEHFVHKFEKQHNFDVRSNAKACFRLRVACEKAKRVLSANKEASISIECLVNDTDVEGVITREEFESTSSYLLRRIVSVCEKALEDAGLLEQEIHSAELVGSGSRIPKISNILEHYFGWKMSRTLNASECVANGCALQCAMLSPALGAKTYGVQDIFPFSFVGYTADKTSAFTSNNRFPKGQFFLNNIGLILPPSKTITIDYADFNELPPDVSENINRFKIVSIDESEKINLEFRIQFNLHGIVSIQSAFPLQTIAEDLDEQEEPMDIDGEADKSTDAERVPSSETQSRKDQSAASPVDRRRRPSRHTVEFSETGCGAATQDVLETARNIEKYLEEQDRANERAKNRRNDLETCLYQIRSEFLGGFGELASKSSKASFTKQLEDIEEWLYGSGADESEEAYNEKLEGLNWARKILSKEHTANMRAIYVRDALSTFVDRIPPELSGKLRRFVSEADNGIISDKLQEIRGLLLGDDVKSENDYIMKMGELQSLIDPIVKRYKDEEARNEESVLGKVKNFIGLGSSTPEPSPMELMHHPQNETWRHGSNHAHLTDEHYCGGAYTYGSNVDGSGVCKAEQSKRDTRSHPVVPPGRDEYQNDSGSSGGGAPGGGERQIIKQRSHHTRSNSDASHGRGEQIEVEKHNTKSSGAPPGRDEYQNDSESYGGGVPDGGKRQIIKQRSHHTQSNSDASRGRGEQLTKVEKHNTKSSGASRGRGEPQTEGGSRDTKSSGASRGRGEPQSNAEAGTRLLHQSVAHRRNYSKQGSKD